MTQSPFATLPAPHEASIAAGAAWRAPWSPLSARVRHVLELSWERDLDLDEIADVEMAVAAAGLRADRSRWLLEFFDRVSIAQVTEDRVVIPAGEATGEQLARLLVGLERAFGLWVEVTPWGVAWSSDDLALEVAVIGDAYEIRRLD